MTAGTGGFAYVVLCHRDPAQVLDLAGRIHELSPEAAVVVRHDRGPDFLAARHLGAAAGRRAVVVDDAAHPVRWGGWSMVEATERAFARARDEFDPDWVVLLSGQDRPARDLADWEAELVASGADAVLKSAPVDLSWSTGRRITEADLTTARWTHSWRDLPANRVVARFPAVVRRKVTGVFASTLQWYQRPVVLRQLPRGLGWKVGVRRRSTGLPDGWVVVKGEQWLALRRTALDAVERTSWEQPAVRRFFAGTHIPDESYLQTVVSNTPGLTVVPTGTSWHRFEGPAPSPRPLGPDDVAAAVESGLPFARKVVAATGVTVTSALDAAVDARRATVHG